MIRSSVRTKKEYIDAWSEEIQRAGTLTVLHTNAIASHIGLSATEFEAVDVISRNQPITAGELAVACGLTTGAITGLVDRLVAEKVIKRVSDPNDRRKVLLVPVKNSQKSKKIRELYRPLSENFEKIAHAYTKDELQFLIDSQAKLNAMANEMIRRLNTKK